MKKILLAFSSLLIVCVMQAQITITQSNMPTIGKSFINANDTGIAKTFINVGNAGASQTWNLTSMVNKMKDTSLFTNPNWVPCAGSFPGATHANLDNGGSGFFNVSSTKLDVIGFCQDTGAGFMPISINPSWTFLTFPSTYLTAFADVAKIKFQFYYGQSGIDSIRSEQTISTTNNIDGWGTVTTPSFSNVNCLRQKSTEVQTDSTFVKGTLTGGVWAFGSMIPGNPSSQTSVNYKWMTNSSDFILAEIYFNAAQDTVTDASYLFGSFINGIDENATDAENISIMPNPANDILTLTGYSKDAQLVIVRDLVGKEVYSGTITDDVAVMNVTSFSNGIYIFQVTDASGNVLGKGRFAVSK